MGERHKRSTSTAAVLKKLKLKKLKKLAKTGIAAAAISGVIPGVSETLPIPARYSMPDESEEDHGERHKRGLPDFSSWKQKPVKNCVTQKKCTNVPKRDCGIHKKETCIPFPKKKC